MCRSGLDGWGDVVSEDWHWFVVVWKPCLFVFYSQQLFLNHSAVFFCFCFVFFHRSAFKLWMQIYQNETIRHDNKQHLWKYSPLNRREPRARSSTSRPSHPVRSSRPVHSVIPVLDACRRWQKPSTLNSEPPQSRCLKHTSLHVCFQFWHVMWPRRAPRHVPDG